MSESAFSKLERVVEIERERERWLKRSREQETGIEMEQMSQSEELADKGMLGS